MIVSHKYRFIFIKTGKVGGTSLEIALSKFLGPRDIATPITLEDEEERYDRGFATAQNFQKSFAEMGPRDFWKWLECSLPAAFVGGKKRAFARRKLPRKFWNHMGAEQVRDLVGKEVWDGYFKFTVERNPWDKVVSMYYWDKKEKRKGQTFHDFVSSGMGYKSDFDFYSIGGIPQADKIVLYHRMEEGLTEVSEQVGLPENLFEVMKNIRAKGKYRRGKGFREHYDEHLKRIVSIQYAREIALLGFDFDMG